MGPYQAQRHLTKWQQWCANKLKLHKTANNFNCIYAGVCNRISKDGAYCKGERASNRAEQMYSKNAKIFSASTSNGKQMETDTNTESLSTLQVPVYDAPALISWLVWCQTLQNHLLVTPTLEYFFVLHNF